MKIRQLTHEDGADYQDLRLTALQSDPDSYLSTYDSEKKFHGIFFANEIEMVYILSKKKGIL